MISPKLMDWWEENKKDIKLLFKPKNISGVTLGMLTMETNLRYKAMLELLYYGAVRVEELCNLKWRHLQERDQTGQIAVYGKGKKTRYVLLDSDTWADVWALRETSKLNNSSKNDIINT